MGIKWAVLLYNAYFVIFFVKGGKLHFQLFWNTQILQSITDKGAFSIGKIFSSVTQNIRKINQSC